MSWWNALKRLMPVPTVPPTDADNRRRAVERARRISAGRSLYVLGAGGRDPAAREPFTRRKLPDGRTVIGSDCVGFTSWCLGHDRYQPETFDPYDGWINTDSLMMDARGAQSWYREVMAPEPGDVVVFPSIYLDGRRRRMGHIGLVVDVPPAFPADVWRLPFGERSTCLSRVRVIDCAGSSSRAKLGRAVAETTAAASWNKPDAMWARCVRTPQAT